MKSVKKMRRSVIFSNIELGYDYKYWGGESGQDIQDKILKFAEKIKVDIQRKKYFSGKPRRNYQDDAYSFFKKRI